MLYHYVRFTTQEHMHYLQLHFPTAGLINTYVRSGETCHVCFVQETMPKGLTLGKIAIILATGATVLYILMITIEHLEPKHTKMRPNNL